MHWTALAIGHIGSIIREIVMNRLIYIIGLVVVIVAVLAFFGFR